MIIKKFLILFIFSILVFANQIEINSNELIKKDDLVYANDGIVFYKEDYFAKANRGIYNEKTKELELFGDVFVMNKEQNSLSSYAKIKLDDSCANFDNFFVSDSFMEMWLKSKDSQYANGEFVVNKASVSSCNVDNPDWNIDFSKGIFNSQTKDLTLKNMVLKFKGVPVFYMPYLRINTDDSRKTGFLVPKIAIKSKEVIFYEQPFFLDINHRMDLEFRPQIRTNRGYGVYVNFRFVDSPYSNGYFVTGYFKEFAKYVRRENLEYNQHYGFNFHYERDKIFNENNENQEGLYIDFLKLNDVDFLNLSTFLDNSDDAIITSKANYFYSNNKDYYGINIKYYQDTSKINQDDTLQELPNLHYHRFYDTLFDDYISYRFDAQYNNYYRKEGSTLNRISVKTPIEFKKSFFKDYFNLVLKEELDFKINLYDKYYKKNDFIANTNSSVSIYTNLFKQYDEYLHNINFGISAIARTGKQEEENEFYVVDNYDRLSFNVELAQLLYKGKDKKLKHIVTLKTKKSKFDLLNNQIKYYINPNLSLSNTTEYSFSDKKINSFFVEGNYKVDELKLGLGYFYNKKENIIDNEKYDRFISSKINYEFMPYTSLYSKAWYNLNSNKFDTYSLGVIFKKKCINYTIEYKEYIDSKLTQKGIESRKDRGIYLKFNLYPIGGAKYNFSLDKGGDDDF